MYGIQLSALIWINVIIYLGQEKYVVYIDYGIIMPLIVVNIDLG